MDRSGFPLSSAHRERSKWHSARFCRACQIYAHAWPSLSDHNRCCDWSNGWTRTVWMTGRIGPLLREHGSHVLCCTGANFTKIRLILIANQCTCRCFKCDVTKITMVTLTICRGFYCFVMDFIALWNHVLSWAWGHIAHVPSCPGLVLSAPLTVSLS